jgi:chromate reductase, NAD(P)H dehydrogenase (quinone)
MTETDTTTPEPVTIATMVGSLRTHSINRRLFNAVKEIAPPSMTFHELAIDILPHYNQDLDRQPPDVVEEFRNGIRSADGVLIVTPEYNYSIPGVLKNAIDWASRPSGKAPIAGKPGLIMGAAIGRSGTMRAQLHLRQILSGMNVLLLVKPEVYVTFAGEKFDSEGRLIDDEVSEQISAQLSAFADWIALLSGARRR